MTRAAYPHLVYLADTNLRWGEATGLRLREIHLGRSVRSGSSSSAHRHFGRLGAFGTRAYAAAAITASRAGADLPWAHELGGSHRVMS